MRTTIIVLVALCLATSGVAAPVAADDHDGDENVTGPCVTIYLDSPGVVIDVWCLLPDDIPPS